MCAGAVWPCGLAAGTPLLEMIQATGPQRAALKLEALGTAVTGENFVRAVATQHRPLVDLFLASGLDVNSRDAQGRTPLLVAAAGTDATLADRLLAAGADPGIGDNAGRTPLMVAAMRGDSALFQTLRARGADPAATDEHGHTALHYAVAARQRAIARELLELEPNVGARCCDGQSLLTHALTTRDWPLIESILSRHPPTLHWTSDTRALLADALNTRDLPKIRLLLGKHMDPPTPEGSAQPLLAWAVARDNLPLCQLLLDCGADPNTPVGTPAGKDFLEALPNNVVKEYLASEPGMTTLMVAAGMARPNFVKLLLEKGANRATSTESKHKLLAVYFAAWAQSPEAIQLLLGNAPPPEKLRIEISLADQRARLIKDGVSVLSTDISTGRPGFSTPEGRFVVTDKHDIHMSTIYKVKMPFFMRLNCRDFGMHEGSVADHFASHGCIRLPSDVARRLFREVPIGTLVTIAR